MTLCVNNKPSIINNNNAKKIFLIVLVTTILFIGAVSFSFADNISPIKQIRDGIDPEDVLCNDGLVLVIKNNGSPACVKENHVFRLLQSGWALKVIPENKTGTITVPSSLRESGSITLDSSQYSWNSGESTSMYMDSSNIGLAAGGATLFPNYTI